MRNLRAVDSDLAQGTDDTAVITVDSETKLDDVSEYFNENETVQHVVTRYSDTSGLVEIPVYNQ